MRRPRLRACALLLVLGAATAVPAAGQYEPRLRFRVLETTHFRIYFHQGEEAAANHLAEIAEDTRPKLAARLGLPAPALTHVILVDQTDLPNGWATPLPYDTIEITAIPPQPKSFLGNTDDWLRLVFTHEYTHILHLDRSGGVMAALRTLFGRTPPAFPNLYLPIWQIEGIATYAESELTGRGRLHAGDFAGIMSQAARAGRFEPIDRAGGGLVGWPSGNGPYLYGGFFTQYLAEKYGESTLGELARQSARRLPLLGAGAFKATFGKSASQLWTEFQKERTGAVVASTSTPTAVRRLTAHGYNVSNPRFIRDRGNEAGGAVWYSVQTPEGFPGLFRVRLEGGSPERLGDRFQGDGLTASRNWAYFDQLEISGAVSLFSDLYARDLSSGRTWRLTTGSRIADPDVSPDASRLAVVIANAGHRFIAILRLREPTESGRPPVVDLRPVVTLAAADAQYLSPRWAPDGTRLVAERQGPNGVSDIVLVDASSGTVSTLVTSLESRNVTPSWSPDGRFVVFASAKGQEPFQLFRVPVDDRSGLAEPSVVPVLSLEGGAMSPEIAPDGRTVVFVGLTDWGYDLFSAPLPAPSQREDATVDSAGQARLDPARAKHGPAPPSGEVTIRSVLALGDAGATVVGATPPE